MAWLKYYSDEHERQPVLHAAKCTEQEAVTGIKKLCRHYKVKLPAVRFTRGRRSSRAGAWRITLNVDCLNWLLVIHEFCHTWHRQYSGKLNKGKPQRWHGRVHRKLVDRACRYALKKNWHAGVVKKVAPVAVAPVVKLKDLLVEDRLARIAVREKLWQAKLKRAQNALRKLARSRSGILAAQKRKATPVKAELKLAAQTPEPVAGQAPLSEHFNAIDRGTWWEMTCKKCRKCWSLKKDDKHPGNLLYLLNHAGSHG